jgi:hypothetical protein
MEALQSCSGRPSCSRNLNPHKSLSLYRRTVPPSPAAVADRYFSCLGLTNMLTAMAVLGHPAGGADMVNGSNARKHRPGRLCLLAAKNDLKTHVIFRNSFKTNNSVDFYSIQTNFLPALHPVSRVCEAQRQSCQSLPPCAGVHPELKWDVSKPKQRRDRGTVL